MGGSTNSKPISPDAPKGSPPAPEALLGGRGAPVKLPKSLALPECDTPPDPGPLDAAESGRCRPAASCAIARSAQRS